MVDVAVLIRDYLLTQTSVTSLLGTSNPNEAIYCYALLPEKYDAAKGPAVQLVRSGGMSDPEIPELIEARLQVRVWADQQKRTLASQVYGAVHDAIHGLQMTSLARGTILSSVEVTGAQEGADPDSSWTFVNSFYTVMARPN